MVVDPTTPPFKRPHRLSVPKTKIQNVERSKIGLFGADIPQVDNGYHEALLPVLNYLRYFK